MGSGGSSHSTGKKTSSATSSNTKKTANQVKVGITGDNDGGEHFLQTSYKQTFDTNQEQDRNIKSSKSLRNGGRSGHRDYKMENSDTAADTVDTSEKENRTKRRQSKKSKSTTDFESHWSDDGDVLAIVVPQQWQETKKDRRGSDSSLDENIREIERTISADSGLATSAMAVTPVMALAKAIVGSNEPETEHNNGKDEASVSSDFEEKFFSKRSQDSSSSAPTNTTVRPQTSYANISYNRRLSKGCVTMPRRRSIAPLLKLEKTKDSLTFDRDLQSAEEKEEDWEYKQPEIEGFDPAKFKEVNSFATFKSE